LSVTESGLTDFALADSARPDLAPADLALPDLSSLPDLATGDLARPVCTTQSIPFCDGFESLTVLPVWTQTILNGTVSIDTGVAYRGKQSLHLRGASVLANQPVRAYVTENVVLAGGGRYYLRAFAKLAAAPTATASLLQAAGGLLRVVVTPSGVYQASDDVAGASASSTVTVPFGSWTCLEWRIDVQAAGALALDGDGAPLVSLPGVDTRNSATVGFTVGLDVAPAAATTPVLDLWIDDLLIDTQPIGCIRAVAPGPM
jgi:hypothetical protein